MRIRHYLILFAVAFVLLALRRPDALTNPQFWAEDGVEFFYTQVAYGTWHALVQPHAGYLHLIPRLVAAGSSVFPARVVPLVYNLSAFSIAAWSCTIFSLPWCRPLLRSDSQRTLLCLLMATSFYADELIGTITNAQWFLFVPALLILILPAEKPERSPGRVTWVAAGLVFLIGLSAPLVAILLPVAVWTAKRRGRRAALVPAALILATFIQVGVALLGHSSERPGFSVNAMELVKGIGVTFIYRVVFSSVAGHRMAEAFSDRMGGFAAVVVLLVVVVGLVVTWWNCGSSHRWSFATSACLLFASLLLALSGRSVVKEFLSFSRLTQWRHERYFFAGACLFGYLVAICIERWCGTQRPAVSALVLLAVFGGGLRNNFHVPAFPDYAWAAYAPAIDQWSRAVRSGTAVAGFAVPIYPSPIEIHFPVYTPGQGREFSPLDSINVTAPARSIMLHGNPSKAGVFRNGFFWLLDVDGNGEFRQGPDMSFAFGGIAGDIPITGDWNGSGRTKVGVYRSSNGLFVLDYNGDGIFTETADKAFSLGVGIQPADIPVTGDWNGDGRTKVGLFRQGHLWLLDYNGDGTFENGVDRIYEFGGVPGDKPVVGDWTGSGTDKIGLVRRGDFWVLDANGNGKFDGIGDGRDFCFPFPSMLGDLPIVGDWNGDGRSKPGLFRFGVWVLDHNGNYRYDGVGKGQDVTFSFGGAAGDRPVVGKWGTVP